MKRLRVILAGLGVFALVAALLLWFLPVRWVLPMVETRLHGLRLEQVGGLVWNGSGTVVGAQGEVLGRVHWRLSRRALFGGIHLDLDADGAHGGFSGRMQRLSADQVDWQDVKLRLDASTLAALAPGLPWPLGGVIDAKVDRAHLQGNWPMELDAQVRWIDAAVTTADGQVPLGRWQLEASGQSGAIRAKLEDGGGPLQVAGQLQLSPLGWRFIATLTPRKDDPALRRWLATLAPPAADGAVHIERGGGLAVAASVTESP